MPSIALVEINISLFTLIRRSESNEQTMEIGNTTSAFIIVFGCKIMGIQRKANCSQGYWQESISRGDWLNQSLKTLFMFKFNRLYKTHQKHRLIGHTSCYNLPNATAGSYKSVSRKSGIRLH